MTNKKILIIEDDKNLVQLLREALSEEKYETIMAINGNEGIEKSLSEKPSLILLDILLPGMSGFDILKEIKSNKQTKKIPVLILSNLGQDQEIQTGMELGAKDYIVKSDFTINQVITKVKRYIK